jgi:hypothetical protein
MLSRTLALALPFKYLSPSRELLIKGAEKTASHSSFRMPRTLIVKLQ